MSAPVRKRTKTLLEKDCDFQIGVRQGRVLELRDEGYFVFWEAWTDLDTGECHESDAGVISFCESVDVATAE
jgi:quinol monooxygenase YgiN